MPKSPKRSKKKAPARPAPRSPQGRSAVAATPNVAVRTRADTKQANVIAMLRRPAGATVAQIAKAFGWQHHTVRGVLSGALKKKLGMTVTSSKPDGGERVYRIAD